MIKSFCLLTILLCCGICSTPQAVAAQDLAEDPFASLVLGEWSGTGEYDGNTLTLTRSWTLELLDQFLKADMQVSMPNGFTFRALMYWKLVSNHVYEVVWMDGMGRLQTIHATRDPDSEIISSTFLDELAENGPQWSSWEFESLGPNSYVERLYTLRAEGKALVAVFSFVRVR